MKIGKLKDVVKLTMGQSPSSESYNEHEDGIPFFQGKADFGKLTPRVRMYCNEPSKVAQVNDILMSVRAPVGDVNISNINCCIGRGLAALTANEDKLYYKYLYYVLNYKKQQISDMGTGSTFKAINKSILEEIEIPLYELEIQQKIANTLDKAQKLIDKRKEQIEACDELIKSQFIEMFGDIPGNTKKWDTKLLWEISELKSGGTPSRQHPEYFMGDIPWITTVALGKVSIDEKDAVEYITQEAIDKSATKLIPAYSLLFGTRVGVGKISINKVSMCTNQDIVAIVGINKNQYNQVFLKNVIDSYSEYFNQQKRGATIQGIKSETIKNIAIPVVKIELQNEFAEFVQQVNQLKNQMQESLIELENNFNSLIQRAFKGELF